MLKDRLAADIRKYTEKIMEMLDDIKESFKYYKGKDKEGKEYVEERDARIIYQNDY